MLPIIILVIFPNIYLHRLLYVVIAVSLCVLTGGLLIFFLMPRDITVSSNRPFLKPKHIDINVTAKYANFNVTVSVWSFKVNSFIFYIPGNVKILRCVKFQGYFHFKMYCHFSSFSRGNIFLCPSFLRFINVVFLHMWKNTWKMPAVWHKRKKDWKTCTQRFRKSQSCFFIYIFVG